ncbi:MAG: hypothetical protein AABY08_02550, partial [Candidatus Thermoplasmatota archaeon]
MLWRARRRARSLGRLRRRGRFVFLGMARVLLVLRVLFAAPLAERPALADLRGLVDPKLEGLDDPDA